MVSIDCHFSTVRLVLVLYIFIRIFVCELIWSIKFMSYGVSFLLAIRCIRGHCEMVGNIIFFTENL